MIVGDSKSRVFSSPLPTQGHAGAYTHSHAIAMQMSIMTCPIHTHHITRGRLAQWGLWSAIIKKFPVSTG